MKHSTVVSTAQDAPAISQHSCHNCRRQRLRCDRTTPECSKCIKRGQECLGYQRLFRWQEDFACRRKLSAARSRNEPEDDGCANASALAIALPPSSLTDPLVQDLDRKSKLYISYFAGNVCRNLVLYDSPKQNPFRNLIPLIHQFPVLGQIIIATSALHMFNSSQTHSQERKPLIDRAGFNPYLDALTTKQRALKMLRHAVLEGTSGAADVVLAVMILFIEFELMDFGRSDWKHHIEGARTVIRGLCRARLSGTQTTSPIRSCLISNWMVFDILASTATSPNTESPLDAMPDSVTPHMENLLRDAEGTHCSSFPATLLQLLQSGTQLSNTRMSLQAKHNQLFMLVCAAKSFDPLIWATELQPRSPSADLQQRARVARAHKAAVTIYLSRLLLSTYPDTKPSCDFEAMVMEIVDNISDVRRHDDLFSATTWPAFVAGAESNVVDMRKRVAARFRELWKVEPWGLMRRALETMETIWAIKSVRIENGATCSPNDGIRDGDWILYLKETGVDWLIL
ncbi:hypothetical protein AUEXF2481DRAFT_38590 [Aureobasidium subglaciale EXF-2481]|uniref:Zn(2)-C6 fungal-type domain-containing protein n=1 Tax=Aureobasidium subglaciale (strain EXF-2481) TaxID=1043005 RepID=A0A074ZC89_AURSE|nr:uncharacterized protein AUEXF2481DRAFT_38590 [Aureobasidium subglaciale EXF-2481]KEQ96336.1 hypothetical protein AUEXF2481DRAFT_38590 [Aureobasidium subglaciale EXF-2481]